MPLKHAFVLYSLLRNWKWNNRRLTPVLKPETSTFWGAPTPCTSVYSHHQALLFLLDTSASLHAHCCWVRILPELWEKANWWKSRHISLSVLLHTLARVACVIHKPGPISLYCSPSFNVQNPYNPALLFLTLISLHWQLAWSSFSAVSDSGCFTDRMLHKDFFCLKHSPLLLHLANCYSPLVTSFDDAWNLAPRFEEIPFPRLHSSLTSSYHFTFP